MIIRPATEEDLPATLAIYNELIPTTTVAWTEELQTLDERLAWFHQRTERGFPVLVAVDHADDVIGTATYGDFRDSRDKPGYRFTVEHSVHVRRDQRRNGVGRALMLQLIEGARRAGVHVMVGGIDGANTDSIVFHERLGFVEVARMPETGWKFGRWLDLVLVQLTIDPGAGR